MVDLSQLDAYSKTDPSYKIEQGAKNVRLALFSIVLVFVIYLETSAFMGAKPEFSFDVARGIQETFQTNLDITLVYPCSQIDIFIQDLSGDRLFVNELVQAHSVVPTHLLGVPEAYKMPDEEKWCRIIGQFDANRVRGSLSIVPKFMGGFNPSHEIVELSFGEFYPLINNPLDHTRSHYNELGSVVYLLSIFPTTITSFGASIETSQYSVEKVFHKYEERRAMPGIFFMYDFEAISVNIRDERIPFFMWACRVINIIGGVTFMIRIGRRFFKNKVLRDEKGLLG